MQIKPRGYKQVPLRHGRSTVWARFTAHGRPLAARPDVTVELDIAVDDGQPHCTGVTVRSEENGPVGGQTLRDLPIKRLMDAAVARASMRYTGPAGSGHRFDAPSPEERLELHAKLAQQGARVPRKGSRLTDEELADVAKTYSVALEAGKRPTKAVQAKHYVGRATASRWVAEARRRGFLGPATPRRASA